jgi:predicted Zn finger-like uncharacterized protein
MYTQCPECGVAFRVTAEVLKMAAGKVRCGGCGIAFNALEHLSEQKPTAPARNENAPDSDVPELKPESPGELEADTRPQSISAEQSAALLKTLDQLAGDDIRIEDTGVEWRVLGDDEDDGDDELDDQREAEAELELMGDTGSMRFIIESEEDAPADEDAFEQASDKPTNVIDEMRFDDDTVLPDDFDEVVVAPSPARLADVPPPEPEPEPEAPQFDLDLSEPEEWADLLGDFSESSAGEDEVEEVVLEMADEADDEEDIPDDPLDMDTQFALQAEAMGIDLSGIHETAQGERREADDEGPDEDVDEQPGDDVDEDAETSIEEDLIAAAFEAEAAAQANEETDSEEALEEDNELEIDLQPEDEEEAEDDVEDIALSFDDDVEEMIETLSMSLDDEPEDEDDIETSGDEHAIPEMSEEEKTINRMIDQELLNIAVEDEDGFASTIVQRQPNRKIDAEIGVDEDRPETKKKDKDKESEPPVAVETIIMEGEFVRAKVDRERPAADTASSDTNNGPGFSIPLNKAKDDYARRREMTGGRPGAGIIAGIVGLVLLLVVQAIHQSREALATVPAFNSAVGPIYRLIGKPLTPTWDIAGWRFEATKGDADETSQILTIYSRIGNNSDEALPYPIVHLALTDRFEDIMGSTLLEPGEYLPENADPRRLVPPGDTVDAMITINAPVADATGFKLMMCYRMASGQLRCKTEDFK